jgi:chromosome segregation ATPase
MNRLTRGTRTLVVLGLVATAGFATLRGQREAPESDDMKALVGEVRALRLAIERAAASSSQSQLLLGRVQLQENRLATLGRQYQEARTRSRDAQMAEAELENQLRQMADRLDSGAPTPPEERRALEQQVAHLKIRIARQQPWTAQLRSDEAAAADVLSAEQQRWADFNNRLEGIERTLARDAVPPK